MKSILDRAIKTLQYIHMATKRKTNESELNYDTKQLITILSLFFVFPLGILFMWLWMKWKTWVKVVLTFIMFLPLLFAIPLAIALIAINPSEQFAKANNVQRESGLVQIANAIKQYKKDNNDMLPESITTQTQEISTAGADLCESLVPEYIPALPADPSMIEPLAISNCSEAYVTGYTIVTAGEGSITISAPEAELGKIIQITR